MTPPSPPSQARSRSLPWTLPLLGGLGALWGWWVWRSAPSLSVGALRATLLLVGLGGLALAGAWILRLTARRVRNTSNPCLAQAEDEFRQLMDLLPVGTAITDATGRVLHGNRKAIEFFGMTEEQTKGMLLTDPTLEVLQADGNPMETPDRPLTKVLATGRRVEDVIIGIQRPSDQDWAWAAVTAQPRFNADGQVQQVIVTFEDITKKRAAEAELALQTFRDRLTSLPNRTLFMERLAQAILRTERRKLATAVLFLDMDRFKVVNDSLGHESGDGLLVQIAKRLRGCVRPEDTVARLSGDEFVILFEDLASMNDGLRVAERIAESMAEPFVVRDQEIFTTCSMGLAVCTQAGVLPSDLVRDAEVAMYRAKAKGEGTIEIFDPSMNAQAMQRFQMESELRRALERHEFVLHYQPLISLRTGRIEGWEALVRWQHPEKGMVPPFQFIPLAEETGLIVPIGKWVLEEAMRQAAIWHEAYPADPPHRMSVNISARQFQQKELVATVMDALGASGFSAECLKLEITESLLMRDPQASLEAMKVFRALDIHLVIDDFGTGYSSLSYLKRFPVDTLKVDKSFVDGLGKDPESTAIVGAVISLAKALGMRVTAEGIETAEQLARLRELNCDQGQGYHFAKPLPAAQAGELLAKNPAW